LGKNINISVVLPSRGRPERLDQLLESISLTATDLTKLEVVILLDKDDSINYSQIKTYNINCNFIVGNSGRTMGELNQDCVFHAKGDVIFFMNDDVIFRSLAWDIILLEKISLMLDSKYIMYPNDLFKGSKLCTFPIMDRKFLLKNLDIIPSNYLGSFMDLHIMDIFKAYSGGSRILYIPDIVCEHKHYRTDQSLLDDTYLKRDRFKDDLIFIQLSGSRANITSRLENIEPKTRITFKDDSVFQLLLGSASISWKLRIFLYMLCRKLYIRIQRIISNKDF
tara:strand:+ start:10957 stop:11796 length:840 start_codon:yes stop_codon:yes gene_type:complete